MKKIDKLILMDFIPPYLMAFFVTEFVLVMQFLWKYIDRIIGKGISFGVLMELIMYFAVRIIPEAVPVTILIASVMVFGNLAEKHEITSMKSAGVSLIRIMFAGVILAMFTALFSLFASNYLKPRANYKFYQRLMTVNRQKATLNIEEGVFTQDFKNFTIYVGEKHKDGQNIENVLIYDNTGSDKSQLKMLTAQRGKMYSSDDNSSFIMDLESGEQYRELKQNKEKNNKPFIRTTFDKWTKNFDMSDFDLESHDLKNSRKKHDLLNSWQLKNVIDSFDIQITENAVKTQNNFSGILGFEVVEPLPDEAKGKKANLPPSVIEAGKKQDKQVAENIKQKFKKPKAAKKKPTKSFDQVDTINLAGYGAFIETFTTEDAKTLIKVAKSKAQKTDDGVGRIKREENNLELTRSKYVLRLHQQFSWAVVCIVFLFIGAPLGSIVRKGGYGYPLLISIIFFMMFIVLNIMGEKLNSAGGIHPALGAWLPNLVLIPIAFFISYKALRDSDFNSQIIAYLKSKLKSLAG